MTHAFDALPPAPATPLTFSSLRSRRYEGFYEGFEETTWKAFGKKSSLSGTAYSGEHVVGDIELRYWSFDIQQLEFKRTVETDMLFSMGSIIFVFTWIYIHVGSYFLAAIAALLPPTSRLRASVFVMWLCMAISRSRVTRMMNHRR